VLAYAEKKGTMTAKLLEDFRTLGELTNFYLQNKNSMSQWHFFDRFSKLAGCASTELHFTGDEVGSYTSMFVLPMITGEPYAYPIIRAQIEHDLRFISANLPNDCTIVDVGCGPGKVPLLFHDDPRIKKILAFDASKDMVEKARELCDEYANSSNIHLFRADVIDMLPLEVEDPALVTCMFGTLGGIIKREDRIKALRNMARMAKGNTLLISVFNNSEIRSGIEYYKAIGEWNPNLVMLDADDGDKTFFFSPANKFFTTWYSREGISRELEAAGLNGEVTTIDEQHYIRCIV